MELLQLKYFQTAARMEHMTQAAKQLHISQPALSKTIASLETELGVKLFERTNKSIRLNEHGKHFLSKVDLALQALEDGKRELQDLTEAPSEFIALDVRVSSHLLPGLLAEYRKSKPDTQFHLLQHIAAGDHPKEFDLCLSDGATPPPGCNSVSLLRESIVVALPADHRLANQERLSLQQLKEERFISLPPGKSLRETTDAFCRLAGFTPHIQFESDDPATVRGLIRAGQGLAFLPAITWGGSTGPDVVTIPLMEDYCERTISLHWPKGRYLTHTVASFRDCTIQYFSELAQPYSKA
ncbi:LysR family transcriptional regulator [Paenibacillus glycanilyticus]|uniref:LysR family transcriptional regulator n=1 Tax=Paenibacillus glycanilyticus TaxID=126569 RepID=A0ABQ6GIE9_9BACL|nr:LysR family transcriptional regulator [Paenibacillus glycanilyticus]GLX70467.1 LysR family transcriptional regulator [Paenibacillus glycanilyticus]